MSLGVDESIGVEVTPSNLYGVDLTPRNPLGSM
ncbi:hypothetical protein T06_8418 [Trichinella sp. T6]|nr:hypothetical protein T06_8418 [Trichinella sp. T6]